MARLQKKKTVNEKVKKKQVEENSDNSEAVSPSKTAAPKTAVLKAKPEKKAVDKIPGEPNAVQKWIEFLREVRIELSKVIWPTRKQTTGTTIVVIIFVFVVAAFLGLFDFGLSKLVQVILT